MENPDKKTKEKKQPNSFLRFTSMASQMAVTIAIGVFGGRELDQYLAQENHTFTLIGSIFGVGVALYFVIKDLSK